MPSFGRFCMGNISSFTVTLQETFYDPIWICNCLVLISAYPSQCTGHGNDIINYQLLGHMRSFNPLFNPFTVSSSALQVEKSSSCRVIILITNKQTNKHQWHLTWFNDWCSCFHIPACFYNVSCTTQHQTPPPHRQLSSYGEIAARHKNNIPF